MRSTARPRPFVGVMICSISIALSVVETCVAPSSAADGYRSAYEPGQAEMRRKREAIERAAAERRAEAERKAEEIRKRMAQQRAKLAKKAATNTRAQQPDPDQPKVIEIEYEPESGSNDSGNAPKIVEIKGETPRANNAIGRTSPAGGQVYRDASHHYTMTLPRDWRTMTAIELNQCNSLARTVAFRQAVQYDGGFRPLNAEPSSPYILIQTKGMRAKSYEELEQSLDRELPGAIKYVEGALKDWAKNISFGEAAVDRAAGRVVLRMHMDVQGAGSIEALSVGHVGSEEIVFVHCYARQKNFNDSLPVFEQIIDSFQHDDGYSFVPVEQRPNGSVAGGPDNDFWNQWLLGGMFGGAGGGIIGLILLLIRYSNRFVLHPERTNPYRY